MYIQLKIKNQRNEPFQRNAVFNIYKILGVEPNLAKAFAWKGCRAASSFEAPWSRWQDTNTSEYTISTGDHSAQERAYVFLFYYIGWHRRTGTIINQMKIKYMPQ